MKKIYLICICAMLFCALGLYGCVKPSNVNSESVKNSEEISSEGVSEIMPESEGSEVIESIESAVSEQKETYTVEFWLDFDVCVVVKVNAGDSLSADQIPTPYAKTGYTVTWEEVDLTNIQQDIVVEAVATPNTYTITYDANGGLVDTATQEVVFDLEVELAVPQREGYSFIGWTYENKAVVGKWTIADDVTLVANWQKIVIQQYAVTFTQTGYPNIVIMVNAGDSLTQAELPTPREEKVGYKVAWEEVDLSNIQSNITVKAVATPLTFTITYDANGGVVDTVTQDVVFDSDVELAVPQREGYSFIGWTYDGKAVGGKWTITGNVTLVANWQENKVEQYFVTFVQSGYKNATLTVSAGDSLTKADLPTLHEIDGYTVGWEEIDLTNIQSNITVKAVATPNTYTITYDANGGELETTEQDVTFGSVPGAFAVPTREGYTFVCWEYNGLTVLATDAWTISHDVTLLAKWEKEVVVTYTVVFRQDGAQDLVFTVEEGSTFTDIPKGKPKKGHTFSWDEEALELLTDISQNVVVVGKQTPKTYTITLSLKGGTLKKTTITVTYGEKYTLPEPTYQDHEFAGWKYAGAKISSSGTWKLDREDIVLVAVWKSEWSNLH